MANFSRRKKWIAEPEIDYILCHGMQTEDGPRPEMNEIRSNFSSPFPVWFCCSFYNPIRQFAFSAWSSQRRLRALTLAQGRLRSQAWPEEQQNTRRKRKQAKDSRKMRLPLFHPDLPAWLHLRSLEYAPKH